MTNSPRWSIIELPERVDARGRLTFVQSGGPLKFEIARIFFVHDVPPGAKRGGHAHELLEQLLIAAAGDFSVKLDDGRSQECMTLSDPAHGLYLPSMTWCELTDFAPGSVCLVLASARYDETDYIRDYDSFLSAARRDER